MTNCPHCGLPRREAQGARGVAPNYTISFGYRCSNPDCDLCGSLIYPDKEQPVYLDWLAERNIWHQMRKSRAPASVSDNAFSPQES